MGRIYVYPADRTGCGLYRLIGPALALRAQGHTDVELVLPKGRTGDVGLTGMQDETGRLVAVQVPPDADVMVFQRPTLGQLADAVPLIRDLGVAVVVDMDDDLTCIDPRNIAWTMAHPRPGWGREGHTWGNATRACRHATMVTVSTPALLDTYAAHGRGVVLDNHVPASYLQVPHTDSDIIGWAASIHSHPGDLNVVGPAVARVVRDGHPYLAAGDPTGIRDTLGLEDDPPSTGVVPIEAWPNAVTRLGVGIAPLADTRFNRSKSSLKVKEYSACGVPWVASPRAEYRRFHRQTRCGLLAEGPRDWYRQLTRLAGNEALRLELSEEGRAAMAEHTIEGNAWRWLSAWEDALKLQRRQVPAGSPLTSSAT